MPNQRRSITIVLSRKWFDMIASGEKREEYREIKPYWIRRLVGNYKDYTGPENVIPGEYQMPIGIDTIRFRAGYQKNAPEINVEWVGLSVKTPNKAWCPSDFHCKLFFSIKLGNIHTS